MRFLFFYGMGKNIYNGYTTAGAGSRPQASRSHREPFLCSGGKKRNHGISCARQGAVEKMICFNHEKNMNYGNSIAEQKSSGTGSQRI